MNLKNAVDWQFALSNKKYTPKKRNLCFDSILLHNDALSLIPGAKRNYMRFRLLRTVNKRMTTSFMIDDGGWQYVYFNKTLDADDIYTPEMLLSIYIEFITATVLADIIYTGNMIQVRHGCHRVMIPRLPPCVLPLLFTFPEYTNRVTDALWRLNTYMSNANRIYVERRLTQSQEAVYRRIVIDTMARSLLQTQCHLPSVDQRIKNTIMKIKRGILLEQIDSLLLKINNSEVHRVIKIFLIKRIVRLKEVL